MIRGVLLDVDGTLILSNSANAHSWVDAFKEFGHDVSYDKVFSLVGMGGDHVIPTLVPGLDSSGGEGKQIADRRGEIFKERYLSGIKPAPGARALVERMLQDNLNIVIASSAKSDELGSLLQIAGVDDLISTRTTSNDASSSKPSPDIVDVAMQRIDMDPSEVVMIGDTPYDIESAGNAQVGTIAVRCGRHSDEDLKGALAIYDDPEDILAHYDTTPLARLQRA